jgi:hypothetical protein
MSQRPAQGGAIRKLRNDLRKIGGFSEFLSIWRSELRFMMA